ncbi:MAG: ATP synthase F1 subunit epsilon [Alphaproteobacteria bacterium]
MSFNLQIISPDKSVFDEEIEMVIIPGTEGDIGVLSNHMPLITSLRLGNIYIYKNKKIIKKFLVNGGIIEVLGNKCTLLTEDISDSESEIIGNDDELSKRKKEIALKQFYT